MLKVICQKLRMINIVLYGSEGITGLSAASFKENWGPEYQTTNNAGIPDPDGKQYWNFKYGIQN